MHVGVDDVLIKILKVQPPGYRIIFFSMKKKSDQGPLVCIGSIFITGVCRIPGTSVSV